MKAFPQKYPIDASEPHHWIDNPFDRGMDLRDYFAAKAIGNIPYPSPLNEYNQSHFKEYITKATKCAYQIADAMMEARK